MTPDEISLYHRFMHDVLVVNDLEACWYWHGPNNGRYGCFSHNGKNWLAHRASYTLFKGEIPKGLVVRHTCHITKCVNPDHLLAGTQQENIDDNVALGRHARGSRGGNANTTEEKVLEAKRMLAAGYSSAEAAEELDMSHYTVQHLRKGEWKHVQIDGDMRWRNTDLTDQQASEILWLALNCPQLRLRQIAERYGVIVGVVKQIKYRKNFKRVTPIKPDDWPWKSEFKRRW
jgi:hypothetical protein